MEGGFEIFWDCYPRKVAKLAALKAWKKLNPSAELVEAIVVSVDEHKKCKAWRDGFVCHPSTFLTQGRWMDELGEHDFYRARL